jgi:phenylalanyl-tRNA synthetase beta chain
LLARIAGARLLAGSVDVAGRTSAREIRLRPERCRALLGLDLSDAEIRATLERLDLSVRPDGSGSVATLLVGVPGHRGDLAREADLAEEIVRIRGLDHVPATLPSGGAAPAAAASGLAEAARDALMAAGMHETVSLAFAPPATLGAPGLPRAVVIRNPLREDCSTLRTWLLPGLLGALRRNCERGVTDVSIFEVGRVFTAHEEAGLPDERLHAAGLLSGARAAWLSRGEPVDFFDLKGLIEEVGSTMRLGFGFVASSHAFLHPGAQAVVSTEQGPCGWAGALHPALLRNEGLPAALAFEIDLETMALPGPAKLRPIPRHPAVVRDLSFFVDANVAWARLDDALRSTREPWLEAVRILEDYRDPARVPAGQKGIFLSLRYRASDRTLTDDEANAVHERVVAALARGFSISRR